MQPFTCQDQAALALLEGAQLAHLCHAVQVQLAQLLQADDAQTRTILALPQRRDDIAGLQDMMNELLADAQDMVFLGVGGSSLGGQALAQLAGWGTPSYVLASPVPRLHFLDNLDGCTSAEFFRTLKGESARFIVISKSGATLETLAHCLLALDCLRRQGVAQPQRHFVFVVGAGENPLRSLARRLGAPIWEHDPHLPGRFSVLSATGIMALLAAGGDAVAVREGAAVVLDAVRADIDKQETTPVQEFSSPLRGAVAALGLAAAGYDNTVLLAYGDRLRAASEWHRQLWMESLGKRDNRASLVCALGPVDQHSRLQAWLQGRQVNWFTLLCVPQDGYACIMDAQHWGVNESSLTQRCTAGDVVSAQCRATQQALIANGAPVRRLELRALDGHALGGLFMHFMLETMLAAAMLEIDPFNQPAVEGVKQATRVQLRS